MTILHSPGVSEGQVFTSYVHLRWIVVLYCIYNVIDMMYCRLVRNRMDVGDHPSCSLLGGRSACQL